MCVFTIGVRFYDRGMSFYDRGTHLIHAPIVKWRGGVSFYDRGVVFTIGAHHRSMPLS